MNGTAMDVEQALELVQQARAIGAERGINATVAVHDDAGHPLVVVRGKRWHGPYMAMGKARLAAAFAKPTKDLVAQWADRPLFPTSLVDIIPGGVTVNPGGVPLFSDGVCVGAIGVGGGSPQIDHEIAAAAADQFHGSQGT
ncbi:MAG: heme-binding protein [Acidimicrobiaceae bacterium]|nr:heme-binding protein [Acidimicrobiaceae bacterium]MYF43265.1 heme-binding protein [Acidimicrobiaceae bacterium]MYJ34696.1 heme-binding protein [Acidimicrobiaceae bacterium]